VSSRVSQSISLDLLVLDKEIQSRAKGIVKAVVEKYAAAMKAGEEFPPIDVFLDADGDQKYRVADGFHRVESTRKVGKTEILANLHNGGKREAILFSVQSNDKHGLRRTNIDKYRCVEMLLRDPEWAQRSNNWVGLQAGVTHPLVRKIRLQLNILRPDDKRQGRDGKIRSGQQVAHSRGTGWVREDNIHALRTLYASRDRISLVDAANTFNTSPKNIQAAAEESTRQGVPIYFSMEKNERLEHTYKAQIREAQAANKKLLDDLLLKDHQLEFYETMSRAPKPPRPIAAKRGVGEGMRRQGCPGMILSDLHVEERVDAAHVNGLNVYNLEIAKEAIRTAFEAFEWLSKDPRWDMRYALLGLLGDSFSGHIHMELIERNFLSPVQAVAWLLDELETGIRWLLSVCDFELLKVVCKDGNHGRLTTMIRYATRTANSLEWLMFHELARRLSDEPRVEFILEDGIYTYIDVYDVSLGATHGDQFRYQGGIGGMMIPIRRGLDQIRKNRPKKTIFMMGHFHWWYPTAASEGIVINGSAVGTTPYSLGNSFAHQEPCQHFFIVDANRGVHAPTAPIWFKKRV
jgi:hypothetical protein